MTATGAAEAPLRALLTPEAVRERCAELWREAEAGTLEHFRLAGAGLDEAALRVQAEIERNYAATPVPLHSRWRHFELAGRDLWRELAAADPFACAEARARARFDLAIVSVLLDAGAGSRWRFADPVTRLERSRSEGLALATLRLFAAGALSAAGADDPLRVDAAALDALDADRLGAALQVRGDNPLPGLAERTALLRRLAAALAARRRLFERAGALRPGHLYDVLRERAEGGRLPAREILIAVLEHLDDIWPRGTVLGGIRIGDVGRHPGIRREDASSGLVPFHKLSQWLAYSLVEPLEEAGIRVVGLDALTGLAEYRNGGLLVDCGALVVRDPRQREREHVPTDTLVVEWRALTVAALDLVAERVRRALGRDVETLPLASVMQGGTWSAGRRIAAERRPGGEPPFRLALDGTLF